MSGNSTVRCVYHNDNGPSEASEDVYILVNSDNALKYKSNPSSIALTDVVESFNIYWTNTGQPDKVSNDDCKRIFGTTNENDIAMKILSEGSLDGKDYKLDIPEGKTY